MATFHTLRNLVFGSLLIAVATTSCSRNSGVLHPIGRYVSEGSLQSFASEQDLTKFLKDLADAQVAQRSRDAKASAPMAPMMEQSAPAPEAAAPSAYSAGADSESVTNVQHAGVDEGGIVKVHGNHLVVLRRGRLFTVRIGDDSLSPVSAVDAFGPGIDPGGAWYDEMLLSNDTVVVIGYSYAGGGTEVGLFDINPSGGLRYRSTYHLRSNDYYSSRNYASRLIGSQLIFYSPLYLNLDPQNPMQSFPAMRKWRAGATEREFRGIAPATNVFRAPSGVLPSSSTALHTVTVCDLAKRDMDCRATVVMGPPGHVFYVSPGSVYVWTSEWSQSGDSAPRSIVYRLPLDGSRPSALRAAGSPVDQFSFLEGGDGNLNVLVRADGAGDGMWNAEVTSGDVALLRVPVQSFSDGTRAAPASAYRSLPKPSGDTFQNRFVGEHLLYGTGSGWGAPEQGGSALYAYRYATGAPAVKLSLPHGVDRIEALGSHSVVVGTDGKDLHFTPVRLGPVPSLVRAYVRKGASQGELRSHGFFYKPAGPEAGMLGLPISEPGRPGYEHLFDTSASVLFLRNESLRFAELGTLAAHPEGSTDDQCRASCVDWYGNARPLFLKNRVFALLGYELVEGTLDDGRIAERRRVNFAPRLNIAR
jgi:hypothetical protein